MIITQSDFHLNLFKGFRHTLFRKSPYHYSNLGSRSQKRCLVPSTSCDIRTCNVWSCPLIEHDNSSVRINMLLNAVKRIQGQVKRPRHPIDNTLLNVWNFADWLHMYNSVVDEIVFCIYLDPETSPSTLYIIWSMHLQSLKLLWPTV